MIHTSFVGAHGMRPRPTTALFTDEYCARQRRACATRPYELRGTLTNPNSTIPHFVGAHGMRARSNTAALPYVDDGDP